MRKISLPLFILCIFFLGCSSQQNNALLFEISGNGLVKPSYLFGTMHSVPKDRFSIPEKVKEKLIETETLVLEINVDIPLKEQILMAQKIILPNNKTLKDYMPEDEFNEFRTYFIDSLGISENKTDRYMHIKPFFLMGVILQDYFGKIESYEIEFNRLAKKHNKGFKALETIDFQFNLLDTISIEMQLESFEGSNLIDEYNEMLDIYLRADIDGLFKFMSESEGYDEIEESFMNTRNKNWLPLIKKFMSESSLFIAIGAGHLPGEQGIINLLQNEGCNVNKVD